MMSAMPLQELGQTGLQVSRLGLGLAALGRPGYINLGHGEDLDHDYSIEIMRQRSHDVLDVAWDLGIRYFDAARSYGRAEEFLASWLKARAITQNKVVVGSKWGYAYTADWQVKAEHHEIKEHSLERLQAQWLESQQLLGNTLDLYQIHSATLDSGVLDNSDVLNELSKLKAENIAVGLSLSGEKQEETLEKALTINIDGMRLFDAVQATWNILEPSAGQALAQAKGVGLGIIVKEGLANGRLTSRNAMSSFIKQKSLLEHHANELNTTVDALALAAILKQPWMDVVLSGAASIEHLESNIRALELDLDNNLLSELLSLAETPEVYWKTRKQLEWN